MYKLFYFKFRCIYQNTPQDHKEGIQNEVDKEVAEEQFGFRKNDTREALIWLTMLPENIYTFINYK